MNTTRQALWLPLFPDRSIRRAIGLALLLLAVLVIWLPPFAGPDSFEWLQTLVGHVSYARTMSMQSEYPHVVEVSFLMALVAAFLLGIVTPFARINLEAMRAFIATRSIFTRLLVLVVLGFVLSFPFFLQFNPGELSISALVRSALVSRGFLLLFIESVFLTSYFSWLHVLFEITNGIKFTRKVLKECVL